MNIRFWILNLVLAFVVIACHDDEIEPLNTPNDVNRDLKGQEELIESSNKFGFELFQHLNDVAPDNQNLMISPLSVSIALGMAYNGADGITKQEMEQTLGYTGLSVNSINNIYKDLIDDLSISTDSFANEIANSIWIRNEFPVLQDFIDMNIAYYYAEVSNMDFNAPETVDSINSWVADKTHDKIKEVIDEISPQAVMFLINAIYFNANWKYEFDPEDTESQSFYLEDGGTASVDMMQQKSKLKYKEADMYAAVELPYNNEDYSMVIFTPNAGYRVNDLIGQLDDATWKEWMADFNEDSVTLKMPKFKYEYDTLLNDMLITMGMSSAFSSQADFSKINPDYELFISKVIHKTFIDVNEEGTEAAAVTVIQIDYTSIDDDVYITIDKPFLYVIKEKSTNSILFIGKVMMPVYEEG